MQFLIFVEFICRVLSLFSVGFSSDSLLGALCGVLSGSLLFLFPVCEGTELCAIFDFCRISFQGSPLVLRRVLQSFDICCLFQF